MRTCDVCNTILTISIITISMITNQNSFIMLIPINKYLLRYSLFLKFSQALYINWVTWFTKSGTILKTLVS